MTPVHLNHSHAPHAAFSTESVSVDLAIDVPQSQDISCCDSIRICCFDRVGRLSPTERVEHLVSGYVRRISLETEDATQPDIDALFLKFVGSPRHFEEDRLFSLKESGLVCCGRNTPSGKFVRECGEGFAALCAVASFCIQRPELLIWVLLIIKLALDIPALVFADSFSGSSTAFESIEPATWLKVGGLSDLLFNAFFITISFLYTKRPQNENRLYNDYPDEMREVFYCIRPPMMLFIGIWSVFGLVLWSDLETESPHSAIFPIWSVSQLITSTLVPCCIFLKGPLKVTLGRHFLLIPVLCCFSWIPGLIQMGKAIAAVIVGMTFDCNQAVSSSHRSFLTEWLDINSWLLMAGFTSFVITSMWCLCSFRGHEDELGDDDGDYERPPNYCPLGFAALCVFAFQATWTYLGFLFYSEMEGDSVCSSMVYSWVVAECVALGISYLCPFAIGLVFCFCLSLSCCMERIGTVLCDFCESAVSRKR